MCPFVPIRDVSVDDCVRCARQFSERLADELHVPSMYECVFVCVQCMCSVQWGVV